MTPGRNRSLPKDATSERDSSMNLNVDPCVRVRGRQPPVLERPGYRRFDATLVTDLTDPALRSLETLVAECMLSWVQPVP
jgi:hypothetical protein